MFTVLLVQKKTLMQTLVMAAIFMYLFIFFNSSCLGILLYFYPSAYSSYVKAMQQVNEQNLK